MIVFRKIFAYWIFIVWAITYIVLFPLTVLLLNLKAHKLLHKINRFYWAGGIHLLTGLFPKIKRSKKVDTKQPYVFVANHTSFIDIVMTFTTIKNYFAIVGKASLNKIPLFGYMFKRLYIPVDRSSKIGRYRTMQKVYGTLEAGRSIVIYPEGTIPKIESQPHMIKFQEGAFRAAIDKQVPIVPIAFLNHWKIMPDSGQKGAKWGLPTAVMLDPIETKGMTIDEVDQLKDKTYNLIDQEIRKYNKL